MTGRLIKDHGSAAERELTHALVVASATPRSSPRGDGALLSS